MIAPRHTATLVSSRADPRAALRAAVTLPESYAAAPVARIGPTNEYIPFAANIGANVEDQRAFAANPVVDWGFPPGSELPALLANKLWKQSSFIAAGVAETIAEILKVDMLDDGNLPLFVTRLRQAIANIALITEGGMPEPPPTGLVYGRQWAVARALGSHTATLPQMTETAQWTPVLPLTGGVMTGPLVLAGRSADPNNPVTRAELDEVRETANDALPITGGTMRGPLILWREPVEDMEAVTKLYADERGVPRPPPIEDDAPADGSNYVRSMAAWTNNIDCGDYTVFYVPFAAEVVEPVALLAGGITEAPLDGAHYFRRNAAWTNVADGGNYLLSGFAIATTSNALGIPEAPVDNSSYVRRDNGWTNVVDCGNY